MTIIWYVDDLKVCHLSKEAVTAFAVKMSEIFGPKTTISRGRVHQYLGMDMDWSQQGTLIVSMIKYLQKIIKAFPEVIKSTSPSPAGDHLFKVREEADHKLRLEEQAR